MLDKSTVAIVEPRRLQQLLTTPRRHRGSDSFFHLSSNNSFVFLVTSQVTYYQFQSVRSCKCLRLKANLPLNNIILILRMLWHAYVESIGSSLYFFLKTSTLVSLLLSTPKSIFSLFDVFDLSLEFFILFLFFSGLEFEE